MISTHIKTTLVDFDGTLIDSNGCWIEAYLLLCERKKQQPSVSTIDSFDKCTFAEWQGLINSQLGECANELLECAKLAYVKHAPKELVLSTVRSLPIGSKITIITREPSELVRHWLSHYNINIFDEIITVGDERKDEAYYSQPLLLLIDDNYKHCIAAKLTNATVIGVNDHHTEERKAQMREICDLYIED